MPAQKRGWQEIPFDIKHASSHPKFKVSPLVSQCDAWGWVMKHPTPQSSKPENTPPSHVLPAKDAPKGEPPKPEFADWVLEMQKQKAAQQTTPKLPSHSELHTIKKTMGDPASPITPDNKDSDGDVIMGVEASSCTEVENPSGTSDTVTPRSDDIITPKPADAKASSSSIRPVPRGSVAELEDPKILLNACSQSHALVDARKLQEQKYKAIKSQIAVDALDEAIKLRDQKEKSEERRRHHRQADTRAAADTPAAADAAAVADAAAAADAAAVAAGHRPPPGIFGTIGDADAVAGTDINDVKEVQLSFCLCLGLNKKHICTRK